MHTEGQPGTWLTRRHLDSTPFRSLCHTCCVAHLASARGFFRGSMGIYPLSWHQAGVPRDKSLVKEYLAVPTHNL